MCDTFLFLPVSRRSELAKKTPKKAAYPQHLPRQVFFGTLSKNSARRKPPGHENRFFSISP